MTIPMLAGTYPNALLQMIQIIAGRWEDRMRLERAVLNVDLTPWKPLDAKPTSGA